MSVALSALLIVLVVVAIATLGVTIWALVRVVDTMASVKRLADDSDREIMPLVAKTDATLDLLSAEIMRIDIIVDQVQDVMNVVQDRRRQAEDAVDRAVGSTAKVGRVIRDVFTPTPKTPPSSEGDPQ